MGPVVGIDLGTTNTVVGVVVNGQASAMADEEGEKLIPSVVSFHPNGGVLVGRAARARRLVDATNTVYSTKRLIGRSWDTEEVRKARQRFPFEMREGPGHATLVVARGETYTLPEISAFVLRQAKSVAEAALGQQLDRAVITVPANFNDLQRAATKVAGRVAGLEVLRILNEPTAAALAYGYGKGERKRVAVYDFGGGTFDLTLLDLSDNVFEVLATAGNTFLGGDDIDLAIAEAMADAFLAQHRYDPRTDPQAFERLRMAAETLKMRLSSLPDATLEVPEVAYGTGGKALGLTFSMTRAELERLARPMLDSSFAVCRDALTIARLSASDFDEVLLVGGTTRIPLVRQMVEEFFSRPALGHISPDEVVAIGAAIQASALAGVERRRATDVPSAPVPARGGSYPFISSKTEPPVQRKSRPPPIPRRPLRTSPGLSSGADTVAVPDTHPFGRPHQDTSPGLMPEPGVDDRASRGGHEPSATLDGLGPRGRVPTGAGLGPSGPRLDRAPPEHPAIPRAVANLPADGSTLMSAAGEAAAARAALEHALPLVDADDSAYDDITQSSASPRAPLSREEAAARYGNLPLSMPEDAPPLPAEPPPAGPPPPPRRARATGLGGTLLLGPEDVPPGPPADPGRALEPDAVRAVAPPRSGDLLGAGRSPTAPRVELASEHTLEIPAAPATEAPLGWGAAPPPLPEPAGPPGWAAPAAVAAAGMGFQPVVAGVAQPPLHASPPAPLLVDVTPLTLTVETVGGFCHTIIARNTPVPCEQARSFVTASDLQTTVRVRVSQGESNRFAENTLLGELELTGLRPAPRGQVEISVLFRLDADGILDVRALDTATGHSASARVRLVGLPESPQVDAMIARHAAHPAL